MLPGEILDSRGAAILDDVFDEQPALPGLVRYAGDAQGQPVELLKVRCNDGEFHATPCIFEKMLMSTYNLSSGSSEILDGGLL